MTFNFPYTEARRRVPDKAPVLESAFEAVWADATRDASVPVFAGGKSMGGRMASQAAARGAFAPPPDGLVFFGYPLHPPAKPSQRRDAHLPAVTVPMLFLSGTKDPFGTPEELHELCATLPGATLELFEGGDHSIVGTKREDPKGQLLDHALDVAARWMRSVKRR